MATLAVLPKDDSLSFTRLQAMIGLSAGNLITHLRKLEEAKYVQTKKSGNGPSSRTKVILTPQGRQALDDYAVTLRAIIGGL